MFSIGISAAGHLEGVARDRRQPGHLLRRRIRVLTA
jgi:hypothetical protein